MKKVASVILCLAAGAVLAQVARIYEPGQTHLAPCVAVCKQAGNFVASGTCVTADADGGYARSFDVATAPQGTVAAAFVALQAACVP